MFFIRFHMCCVFDTLATYNHTTCSASFQSYLFFVFSLLFLFDPRTIAEKITLFCRDLIYTKKFIAQICLNKHKTHTQPHTFCSVQIKMLSLYGRLENSQHISHKIIHIFCRPTMSARCFYAHFYFDTSLEIVNFFSPQIQNCIQCIFTIA